MFCVLYRIRNLKISNNVFLKEKKGYSPLTWMPLNSEIMKGA